MVTTPVESAQDDLPAFEINDEKSVARAMKQLEKKMLDHAKNLEFEQAAAARDALNRLKQQVLQSSA